MIQDIPGLVAKISEEVRKQTDIGVVGLSGGVDSLVTACLLVKALGKENVVTIHMPYGETDLKVENKFNNNSLKIAEKLGTVSHYIPVTEIADTISKAVAQAFAGVELTDLNKGNARARARMCTLYATSHHIESSTGKRARVVGTGNLSEDFIGYDTKYGDSAWDIGLIGELFKSEVYQLAEYFVAEGLIDDSMIDRKPSAGLWEGQTDEAELGFSYNQMQPAVKFCRENYSAMDILIEKRVFEKYNASTSQDVFEFVWKRHLANKHKHEAPPTFSIRNQFCD